MAHQNKSEIKWKTILGLFLLLIATAFNWMWVYGVLFVIWALNDGFAGVTHFVEEIRRDKNPVLFWVIIALWILLSGYYFVEPWLNATA